MSSTLTINTNLASLNAQRRCRTGQRQWRDRRTAPPRRLVFFALGNLAPGAGRRRSPGLSPQKRGPKSKRDPVAEENQLLRRETQRLTEELRKAEIVIDIQKGWPGC